MVANRFGTADPECDLEIGETFAATLRLEAVLDSVIESGMRLAGGDSGSVMLLSDDGRELVVTAAVGPRASIILGTRQPASASVAGQALQSNTHMVVRGVAGREGGPKSDHPQDLGWGLVMPLRVASRLLGVLNLSTSVHRDELPADRVSLLGILAQPGRHHDRGRPAVPGSGPQGAPPGAVRRSLPAASVRAAAAVADAQPPGSRQRRAPQHRRGVLADAALDARTRCRTTRPSGFRRASSKCWR